MISWYALTTLLRICRKRSKESSARCVARMVECNSSPSPERNRSTDADAFWLKASTSLMAFERTSWNAPPGFDAAAAGPGGSEMPLIGAIGADILHLNGADR